MENKIESLTPEDKSHKVQSEGYRILKYLKAITALTIFNLILTIMWIIGVIKWDIVYSQSHESAYFILFVVSFVFFFLTWIIASIIALVSVLRHFKKNLDIYPKWVYILSNVMIVIPWISIILYIWISKNSININNN